MVAHQDQSSNTSPMHIHHPLLETFFGAASWADRIALVERIVHRPIHLTPEPEFPAEVSLWISGATAEHLYYSPQASPDQRERIHMRFLLRLLFSSDLEAAFVITGLTSDVPDQDDALDLLLARFPITL